MYLCILLATLLQLSAVTFAQFEGNTPTMSSINPITISTWASTHPYSLKTNIPMHVHPTMGPTMTSDMSSSDMTSVPAGVASAQASPSKSVDHATNRPAFVAVTVISSLAALGALVAIILVLLRRRARRAALKRRQHPTWTHRMSQWAPAQPSNGLGVSQPAETPASAPKHNPPPETLTPV